MKSFLLRILEKLLKPDKKNLPPESSLINHLSKSPKILLIRQHNQLGDMLLSNSLFRAIKEKFPDGKLYIIASYENFHAVISNQFIDKVIVFDKRKFWNPINLIRFISDLRKERFELVIVPVTVSISSTSCLIARFCGAKFSIGPATLDSRPNKYSFLFDYKIDVGKENDSRHISDKILDIVRPFGIDTSDLSEHILVREEDKQFARQLFGGNEKIKIGFHIGAGKIPNRWDVNKFAEVINYLFENFNDVIVYLTIGHWDEELLEKILPLLKKKPLVLRNLEIPKLAAVIELSDLFISNDTGIMHVAGSTNTPLIALFGPTNPEIWAPVGKNKFYIKKGNDINLIEVQDVIDKINLILKQKEKEK
jgi:ADP-heptose:LPS heptosyltransferase